MISRMARGLTLCCGMAAALLAAPSESHALCGLFDCLFGGCRSTTYYAPQPCAPTACSPCNTTVCNYMPQTCYRPTCVNVPVTTYRYVSACDPCTGCPIPVQVCLPACCDGEPCVRSRPTLFGCGLVRFDWCSGYGVTVRFTRCGDLRVIYH